MPIEVHEVDLLVPGLGADGGHSRTKEGALSRECCEYRDARLARADKDPTYRLALRQGGSRGSSLSPAGRDDQLRDSRYGQAGGQASSGYNYDARGRSDNRASSRGPGRPYGL